MHQGSGAHLERAEMLVAKTVLVKPQLWWCGLLLVCAQQDGDQHDIVHAEESEDAVIAFGRCAGLCHSWVAG